MGRKAENKSLKTITDIFIYISFTIFVLYCGTNGYGGMYKAKYDMFFILGGGYVILSLLILLKNCLDGQIKFKPKNMGLSSKKALIYLVLTWVSTFMSPYYPDTVMGISRLEGAITISVYMLVFILVAAFGEIDNKMIYCFGGAVLIFSLISVLQICGLNPFILYPKGYNFHDAYISYDGQFIGTIGNSDIAAAFLCIAIPILFFSLFRLTENKRFFLLIPLALSLYVLIKIWVLAGVVGVFVGLMLSLPFSFNWTKKQKIISISGILILLTATLVWLYFSDFNDGLLYELKEILHGNFDDSFGSGRLYIWKSVLRKIPENLWFGTGPDTMIAAGIEPFVRYSKELNTSIVAQIDVAHNEFLNVLFHQGVFAFASYVVMLSGVLYNYFKYGNSSRYTAIFGGAVVCYMIQSLFGFSSCASSLIFWIIAALVGKQGKSV